MKFKSLLLHKRSAIDHAFQLLVSRQVWPHCITFLVQMISFMKHSQPLWGVYNYCYSYILSVVRRRGRWVCRWNSLMAWCVFTDHGCLQETDSSHIKLLTPQGLLCSGNCLMRTFSVKVLFALNCIITISCSIIQWDSSAIVYRTSISSMRWLALNGR